MRLIDADALKKELEVWVVAINQPQFYNLEEALYIIDSAPAADAVPVVRGYSYEDDKTYSGPGTSNYICSACGEMQGTWKKGLAQNQKFKFCPWCGAKMEDKP